MNALIVDGAALAALEMLNASGDPHHQLEAIQVMDGRHVLNADLLGDISPGGTWQSYREFLLGLPQEQIEPAQFITE